MVYILFPIPCWDLKPGPFEYQPRYQKIDALDQKTTRLLALLKTELFCFREMIKENFTEFMLVSIIVTEHFPFTDRLNLSVILIFLLFPALLPVM